MNYKESRRLKRFSFENISQDEKNLKRKHLKNNLLT